MAVALCHEVEGEADYVRYARGEAGEAEVGGLEGGFEGGEVGDCGVVQVRGCWGVRVLLEMGYDCFHLEDGGGGGFAHVDAVFGDFVQGGEVGCFDYMSRRVLADAV